VSLILEKTSHSFSEGKKVGEKQTLDFVCSMKILLGRKGRGRERERERERESGHKSFQSNIYIFFYRELHPPVRINYPMRWSKIEAVPTNKSFHELYYHELEPDFVEKAIFTVYNCCSGIGRRFCEYGFIILHTYFTWYFYVLVKEQKSCVFRVGVDIDQQYLRIRQSWVRIHARV
jgi:hypothetical protein